MDGGFSSSDTGKFKTVAVGVIFGVLGLVLTVWNEHAATAAIRDYRRELAEVTENAPRRSSNDAQWSHAVGTLESSGSIVDSLFGVTEPNAVLLQRVVETYQWEEDDDDSQLFEKTWKVGLIDSSDYPEAYSNPSETLYPTALSGESNITLDGFRLASNVTIKMTWFRPIRSELSLEDIPDIKIRDSAVMAGDGFFFGKGEPSYPEIGDVRVSFRAIYRDAPVSLIAQVQDDTFGGPTNKIIVQQGRHTAKELLQAKHRIHGNRLWTMRLISWAMIVAMFLSGLDALLPEYKGTKPALVSATCFFATVVATLWLATRPFSSLFTYMLVAGGVYWLRQTVESQRTFYSAVDTAADTLYRNIAEINRQPLFELNTI